MHIRIASESTGELLTSLMPGPNGQRFLAGGRPGCELGLPPALSFISQWYSEVGDVQSPSHGQHEDRSLLGRARTGRGKSLMHVYNHLLWTRSLACLILLFPIVCLSPFRWGNGGSERLSNFHKLTQPVTDRIKYNSQPVWIPKSRLVTVPLRTMESANIRS